MTLTEKNIIVGMQSAYVGSMTTHIRMICYKYFAQKKNILFRIYFDKTPSEDEVEDVNCVITQFTCYFDMTAINEAESDCIYSKESLDALDTLDGVIFKRKETFKNGRWIAV